MFAAAAGSGAGDGRGDGRTRLQAFRPSPALLPESQRIVDDVLSAADGGSPAGVDMARHTLPDMPADASPRTFDGSSSFVVTPSDSPCTTTSMIFSPAEAGHGRNRAPECGPESANLGVSGSRFDNSVSITEKQPLSNIRPSPPTAGGRRMPQYAPVRLLPGKAPPQYSLENLHVTGYCFRTRYYDVKLTVASRADAGQSRSLAMRVSWDREVRAAVKHLRKTVSDTTYNGLLLDVDGRFTFRPWYNNFHEFRKGLPGRANHRSVRHVEQVLRYLCQQAADPANRFCDAATLFVISLFRLFEDGGLQRFEYGDGGGGDRREDRREDRQRRLGDSCPRNRSWI
jgi:hypothetical protein